MSDSEMYNKLLKLRHYYMIIHADCASPSETFQFFRSLPCGSVCTLCARAQDGAKQPWLLCSIQRIVVLPDELGVFGNKH